MIQILPAMDIIKGKCVRLTQGDFSKKKVYSGEPVEIAKEYENAGLKYLHLVDLDGARQKRVVNWNTLKEISRATSLKIEFGGGLHSHSDVQHVFECGAYQVILGSVAIYRPELVYSSLNDFGPDKIILGMDVMDNKIRISAWQEETDVEIAEFFTDYIRAGVKRFVCTDIRKDGMLTGPAFDLYSSIKDTFPNIQLVASGGVRNVDDIYKLEDLSVFGVIIGKAIYERTITLDQLRQFVC
jgi:phosphoribosylformimino-5-aminoimidazole carboxamide ribotide isomerase